MYRSVTWLALKRGLPLGDGEPLGELARRHPITFDAAGRVFIDDTDVTAAIRQVRVDRMVPVVARHPQVREVMRERQRELAAEGDVVIEGRDIGTVVAPDAGGEGVPPRRPAGARARGVRPSGPRSAPTRSPPTSSSATSPTRRACSPPKTPRRSTRPQLAIDEVIARHRGARARPAGRVAAMAYGDLAWRTSRLWLAPLTRVADARARATGSSACPRRGGCVLAINHLAWIDVPLVGSLSPRNINYIAKVELAARARLRPLHRVARDHRRAPRRVRPRRGAPDAQLRRARAARSASSSRGRGSAAAGPGTPSRARRWWRSRSRCRSCRSPSTAPSTGARQLRALLDRRRASRSCFERGDGRGRPRLQGGERRDRAAPQRPLRLARRAPRARPPARGDAAAVSRHREPPPDARDAREATRRRPTTT